MIDALLKEKLDELDRLIQSGKGEEAYKELRLLMQKKVPRELVVKVANLSRRIYVPGLAIRLLNPIVRPSGRKALPATDVEKAEYAASLTQVGAAEEATVLLEQINAEQLPQVLLFEAFSLFSQWDYAKAIPMLEKYIKMNSITDYQKLVGKVNLASAFLNERRTDEARGLLKEILKTTKELNLGLLHGNALEMSAQAAILNKDFDEANDLLAEGKSVLTNDKSLPAFLIRKWSSILQVVKSNGSEKSIEALRHIKNESLGIHEETSRDCDRYEAIYTGNQKLFLHLYFGTPFKSFRDRLKKDFPGIKLPENYEYKIGSTQSKNKSIDVFTGEIIGEKASLKRGQLCHRLLMALASDFYMPIRMAALHHKLYPNEFYNPVSSPHQVHEGIRKFRNWVEDNSFPLVIEEKKSFYRLLSSAPCSLRVTLPDALVVNPSKEVFFTDLLKRSFEGSTFQAGEASKILKLPLRSTQRLLSKLHEENVLSRSGEARAVRYSFEEKKAA